MYLSLPVPGKSKFRALVRFTWLDTTKNPKQVRAAGLDAL